MSHMVLSGVGAGRGAGATGRGAMAAPSTASNFSPLRSPAGHLMDWERRFDGGIMRWKRLARRVPAPPADEVSYRRSGMAAPPSSPSKPTAAAFWWGKASCAHADADATHAASNTMAADGADEGAAARKQSSKFLAEANADDESQASADGQPHDTAVNRSARPAHYGLMNLEPGLDPASAATGSLVAPPNDSGTSGTQRPAAERVPTADARSRGRALPSALGARGGAGARGMSFLPTKAIPSAPPPLEQRPSGGRVYRRERGASLPTKARICHGPAASTAGWAPLRGRGHRKAGRHATLRTALLGALGFPSPSAQRAQLAEAAPAAPGVCPHGLAAKQGGRASAGRSCHLLHDGR